MIDVSEKIVVERVSPDEKDAFFGYYDISPESPDGTRVLLNLPPFADHMPSEEDELEIGFVDADGMFVTIDKTTAWNFQEGCRLQWLNNDEIIYNKRADGEIISCVYNCIHKKMVKEYSAPVYSVDRMGKNALSYNFFRCRYSYAHTENSELTDYKQDGVILLDLVTGKTSLVVSLEMLAKQVDALNARNWVEHAVFSPSGEKFFFFHRWETKGSGFFSRFCVSDLQGNVTILLDSGACSHSGWKNENTVSAWARIPNKINSIQKNGFLQKTGLWSLAVKVYHKIVKKAELRQKITNESYVLFDVNSGTNYKIDNSEFTIDGHETWSRNERYMLTDTYPNEKSDRYLLLYDFEKKIVYKLGLFHSFPEVQTKEFIEIPGIRCDLHPKWSYAEKNIYFDSTHEGYRGLYRINISTLSD